MYNYIVIEGNIGAGKTSLSTQMAERGLIDADYGGGVIKQRIARPNEGKFVRMEFFSVHRSCSSELAVADPDTGCKVR